MTARSLAVISLVLWLLLAGAVAWAFLRSYTETAADGRQEIRLTEAERAFVLTQMRTMLATVKGVLNGMAAGDNRLVAAAARTSGAAMAPLPALRVKLPDGFLQLAQQTHGGFDRIAEAAEAGAAQDELVKLLNRQLTNCVSCHAAYSFRVHAAP